MMLFMPSELSLQVNTRERHDGGRVSFELLNAAGGRAIRGGVVVLPFQPVGGMVL
jgi:hypothetical protein